MIEKLKSYYAIHMERLEHRDRIFINNPVVMQGLGLVPIVAVGTNMKNACVMALAVLLLLTPTRVLAALFSRSTQFRFKAVAYCISAATVYVLVSWLLLDVFKLPSQTIGLYLPLLVTEPLVIKRYAHTSQESVTKAVTKGLITTAGFLIVLFISAALREIIGAGTFFGKTLFKTAPIPYLSMIGGGFILVGILIALWRNLVHGFKREVHKR